MRFQPFPQRRIHTGLPPWTAAFEGKQDVAIKADGGGFFVAARRAATALLIRGNPCLHLLAAEGAIFFAFSVPHVGQVCRCASQRGLTRCAAAERTQFSERLGSHFQASHGIHAFLHHLQPES